MIEYTVRVYPSGSKFWYLNDKCHREDGPVYEGANGNKSWYLNDKLHREDGPAVEWANGTKFWSLNGKLHREDGPAMEWADGDKEWWLNGEKVAEEEHKLMTSPIVEMTVAEISKALGKQVKVVG